MWVYDKNVLQNKMLNFCFLSITCTYCISIWVMKRISIWLKDWLCKWVRFIHHWQGWGFWSSCVHSYLIWVCITMADGNNWLRERMVQSMNARPTWYSQAQLQSSEWTFHLTLMIDACSMTYLQRLHALRSSGLRNEWLISMIMVLTSNLTT